MPTHLRVSVVVATLAFLMFPTTSSIRAQRIAGTTVDAATDQPVASAHVVLIDMDDDSIADALSAEDGRFTLAAPRAGSYRLRVSRLGYEALATDTVNIEFNEIVTVKLSLGPAPVGLERLSVVNRSRDVLNDLSYDALYARRSQNVDVGSNRIFVKDDLEFRSAIKTSDLLRYVKPRKLDWDGRTQTWSTCLPIVLWHGFLVTKKPIVEEMLESSAENLEGLESYRNYASIPLAVREVVAPVANQTRIRDCGVIVLWPRRPDYPK